MAQPYLTDLEKLAELWSGEDTRLGVIECRHFFSGAAAYRDGSIVASLTPAGLAFKVPGDVRDDLLERGVANPLRYFPNAPIKANFVVFPMNTVPAATDAVALLLGESPPTL